VQGEVYEIASPAEQLPILDKLEEFDARRPAKSLFVRKKVTVKLKHGGRKGACGYLLPRKPRRGRVMVSGNYAGARQAEGFSR